MGVEKGSFIDIDDVQSRLSVHQVASHYGFTLPPNFGAGGEQRMRCPCNDCSGCDDDSSVSINLDDAMKRWKCHRESYGCGAKGNLLVLAYCMKHGRTPPGGKVRGTEFRELAKELQELVDGPADRPQAASAETPSPAPSISEQTRTEVARVLKLTPNTPLEESDNENARRIATLDREFVTTMDRLSPAASAYVNRHPVLKDEELAKELRFGYCPGSSKSSMRGKYVYGLCNRKGQVLAWPGRNLSFDADYEAWIAKNRRGTEPSKFRFPSEKMLRRGAELYGQEWIDDPRFDESLQRHGLVLVEGFNDRIALHAMGVMSVAIMSNQLTDEQTHKLIGYARERGGNRVGLMHDANKRGDDGAKEALWRLQVAGVDAYLLWSHDSHGGEFAGREPETVTAEEWKRLTKQVESGSSDPR